MFAIPGALRNQVECKRGTLFDFIAALFKQGKRYKEKCLVIGVPWKQETRGALHFGQD